MGLQRAILQGFRVLTLQCFFFVGEDLDCGTRSVRASSLGVWGFALWAWGFGPMLVLRLWVDWAFGAELRKGP